MPGTRERIWLVPLGEPCHGLHQGLVSGLDVIIHIKSFLFVF